MFPRFFTHMDKQATRAVLVVVLMFVIVATIVLIGKESLNLDDGQYNNWFAAFRESDWIVPIVVATFILGSFIGVPQWALLAGMAVAFGPLIGGIGSWVCTMLSASLNFWLARWIGAERIERFGGDLINRIIRLVRKNGFMASLAVRLVPTGPFILVNMAAGISKMRFSHFAAGTGIGIIPKIMVVSLIALGIVSGEQTDRIRIGIIGIAIGFIIIMLAARKHLRRFTQHSE